MSKVKGTVKWFSNKKGFGFVSPTSDNSPTTEEIFVHFSAVITPEGDYKTLVEGSEVEFNVEKEENGKYKAVDVTAIGGGPLKPPPRKRTPRKPLENSAATSTEAPEGGPPAITDEEDKPKNGGGRKPGGGRQFNKKGGSNSNSNNNSSRKKPSSSEPSTPREPPFHDVIDAEVKKQIAAKGVELVRSTVDIAVGDARVKLGQGGYAGLAHASGVIGEGTYTCDSKGECIFTWERCLEYSVDDWKPTDTSKLMPKLSLTDDSIGPVKPGETAESLWGSDKVDPKDAFERNGFKMKKIVLTRPPSTGGRGRRGPPRDGPPREGNGKVE